jgi:Zn-dependent protease
VSDPDLERRLRNLRAVAEHRAAAPAAGSASDPSAPAPAWRRRLAALGPLGVVLIFVLGKLKLVVPLLKMTKLGTLVSMLIAVWAYAWLWGLPFAVGFVLLIFVHELGHAIVLRQQGIPFGAPVFIPFVGAVIAMKGRPHDGWIEALVGIGGPVLGGAGALACLVLAFATDSLFWYALASTGFLLNLFNLIPVRPLDGGRIVGVISPWLWAVGYAVGIAVFLVTHSPILFLILLLGLFEGARAVRAARERYYETTPRRRLLMSAAYFGLVGALTLGMWIADQPLAHLHDGGSYGTQDTAALP